MNLIFDDVSNLCLQHLETISMTLQLHKITPFWKTLELIYGAATLPSEFTTSSKS